MTTRILHLNVGGCYFAVSSTTLTVHDTFFARLVAGTPAHDEFFIDRDPSYFRLILNWLRGSNVLPRDEDVARELRVEADFYCMFDLCDALDKDAHRRVSLLESVHRLAGNVKWHG